MYNLYVQACACVYGLLVNIGVACARSVFVRLSRVTLVSEVVLPMALQDISLPEISVEEFHQASWTRFELAAVAKEWNAAKQLSVVPALLRGKLLDYYIQLDDSEKTTMKALKAALLTRSGIAKEPLSAAKLFMDRVQGSQERVGDYGMALKKVFKEAFPDELVTSAVLLQHFLNGLRPVITQQVLLQKQPRDLDEAIKAATAVEYALNFGKSEQASVHAVQTHHDDRIKELHTLIQQMANRFDSVEAQLRVAKEETVPQDTRKGRFSGQRPTSQCCYGCCQYGHEKEDCPLARKCYQCGKVGHFKECPLKGKGPLVGGQKVAKAELNHRMVYVCSGNSNLKVHGYLAGKPVCFLVDSGASISVVNSELLSVARYKWLQRLL